MDPLKKRDVITGIPVIIGCTGFALLSGTQMVSFIIVSRCQFLCSASVHHMLPQYYKIFQYQGNRLTQIAEGGHGDGFEKNQAQSNLFPNLPFQISPLFRWLHCWVCFCNAPPSMIFLHQMCPVFQRQVCPHFFAAFKATVATGTPLGIWRMDKTESQPSIELEDLMGTPITGKVVTDATIPGRWLRRRLQWLLSILFLWRFGHIQSYDVECDVLETTVTSCGMPNCLRISTTACIVLRSLSLLPMMIPINGFIWQRNYFHGKGFTPRRKRTQRNFSPPRGSPKGRPKG